MSAQGGLATFILLAANSAEQIVYKFLISCDSSHMYWGILVLLFIIIL